MLGEIIEIKCNELNSNSGQFDRRKLRKCGESDKNFKLKLKQNRIIFFLLLGDPWKSFSFYCGNRENNKERNSRKQPERKEVVN